MNDLEKNIIITDLKKIKNISGEIMHILKSTDKGFFGFGEAYFSYTYGLLYLMVS